MINKKSYIVNMTYDISNKEKQQAEKAIICLNHIIKLINISMDHLNLMKVPFEQDMEISSDELINARAALRRFRDKSIENLNNLKVFCFKCVDIMEKFSSDNQVVKLMNSFISNIDDIEESANNFFELFDNLQDEHFVSNAVDGITQLEELCYSLEEFIQDRIKPYIKTNILSKNWVDVVGDEMQIELTQKTPLLLELHQENQKEFNKFDK